MTFKSQLNTNKISIQKTSYKTNKSMPHNEKNLENTYKKFINKQSKIS